jgi:hypothetical protein
VQKCNEKIIYWDGRQKQKIIYWDGGQKQKIIYWDGRYKQKIIYWDGRQKQKHYDWNNPQLYQCKFQNNKNSGQSTIISHTANLNNIKPLAMSQKFTKIPSPLHFFLNQTSTEKYHFLPSTIIHKN